MPRPQPPRSGPAWKTDEGRRGLPVVAIVLGLVVLVAVIAVVASQVSQHDDDASTEGLQQVAPVAVEGAVLAPLPGSRSPFRPAFAIWNRRPRRASSSAT